MADYKEQLLDGLYRSREVLMGRIDKKSLQIKQTYTRAILFLVVFLALIFNRDFKPSAWQKANDMLTQWEHVYGKGYLDKVTYREFLNSQDSITRVKRLNIMQLIDSTASDDSPMLTYYNQTKKGFHLDSLPSIQKQLEDLVANQNQIDEDSAELSKLALSDSLPKLDSTIKQLETVAANDTVPESKAKQLLKATKAIKQLLNTQAEGLYYNMRVKDSASKAGLVRLKRQYRAIQIWVDEKMPVGVQIDSVQSKFTKLKHSDEITPWLAIDKESPSWKWKYKTWKILNTFSKKRVAKKKEKPTPDPALMRTSVKDTKKLKEVPQLPKGALKADTIKIISQWQAIFKVLTEKDRNKITRKIIKPDSLFTFNQQEVKKYMITAKSKQEKMAAPTAEISSTKIPLPIKQVLLVLPLMYAGLLLFLQMVNLKRSSLEIRTTEVEKCIKEHLGGEDLVRSNIFGDEITSGRGNWSYIKKFQFALLFKNNPTYYKDGFFILVSFLLFLYAMYKWALLLQYNPQLINWGIGIAVFSLVLYLILFFVNRNIGSKLRKTEREKARLEREKQGLTND
ncbi:hypothetical protein [Microscilla marina]|uniref:Uncharacterized protein n=1 Tax=Microscilla marina ATCC 23134 TaxID=313606 RepID=A1ZVP1_MICM2|nr:hypothetical protein [Microscilla marina]EAY25584.1 hypothetical protein M23134_00682 [Microscilla marina ATCC 23134]